MIRIIVTGAAGRMGQRLVALTHESPQLQLVGALEVNGHACIGRDAGEVAGCGHAGIPIQDDLEVVLPHGDVVIAFTTPAATLTHLRQVVAHHRAMVIGTTGFSDQEAQTLQELAHSVPCVWSPNMSVGMNVLLNVVGKIVQALGNSYDIEVIEAHHNKKKDAPSGTALRIAEVLANAAGSTLKDVGVYARQGNIGERRPGEIGIQTIRAGDIAGDHTILFAGPGERLEVTHRAHNRDPFARGALRAAEWVITQPPGLYRMDQVLGLTPN